MPLNSATAGFSFIMIIFAFKNPLTRLLASIKPYFANSYTYLSI